MSAIIVVITTHTQYYNTNMPKDHKRVTHRAC